MSQDLIVQKYTDFTSIIGVIPGSVNHYSLQADNAEDQIKRLEIVDAEDAAGATTFIKALGQAATKADEDRKRYTDPLRAIIDLIKPPFDAQIDRLKAVKTKAETKLTAYLTEQLRIAEARAAEEQRRAAEVAAEARASGDDDWADAVEEAAQDVSTAVSVQGVYGGIAGLRRVVTGKLEGEKNIRDFLKWAAKNLSAEDLATITVGKKTLNKLAKAADETGKSVPGLEVVADEKSRVA